MFLRFEEIDEKYLNTVLEIYNYYIQNSTATFHLKSLDIEEMKSLVFFENPRYKAFVILEGDNVCGYVYLGQHKKREAYDDTAEVTIYLAKNYLGQGIGKNALAFIEKFAQKNAYHVLIATICDENTQSINLFEHNGYVKCAHYREVGRKFGRWLGLVAYQKILI